MNSLTGGIIFIIFGILLSIFNRPFGRWAWLGMHSLESKISRTSKEEVYKRRAVFIRFLGIVFIITGLVILITLFF